MVRAQGDPRHSEVLHAEAVAVYEGGRRVRELPHAKEGSEGQGKGRVDREGMGRYLVRRGPWREEAD